MALRKQKVTIPFTAGLDDKISKLVLGTDFLEEIENVDLKTRGEITKRVGSELLENSTATLKAIYPYNDLLLYNQTNTDLWKILLDDTAKNVGEIHADFYGEKEFEIQNENIHGMRAAEQGNLRFVTLINEDNQGANNEGYYYLFDTSNKDFVVYGSTHDVQANSTLYKSWVVSDGTHFYVAIIYDHPSQTPHQLDVFKYNASGSETDSIKLATTVAAFRNAPLEMVQDSTHLYIVTLQDNANDDVIKVTKIQKSDMTLTTTATIADPEAKGRTVASLSAYLDDGQIYIFATRDFIDSSNQFCLASTKINVALSTQSSQVLESIDNQVFSYNTTCTKTAITEYLIVCWDKIHGSSDSDDTMIGIASYDLSDDSFVIEDSDSRKQLAGPMYVAGDILSYSKDGVTDVTNILPVKYRNVRSSVDQTALLLFEIDLSLVTGNGSVRCIGKYLEDTLGRETNATNLIDYGYKATFTQNSMTLLQQKYVESISGGNSFFRYGIVHFEFSQITPKDAVFKEYLFLTGNFLQMYDGNFLTEASFLYEPKVYGDITYLTTGGQFSDGTVGVKLVYRYITSKGDIIDSRPSVEYTLTFTGGTSTQRADLGSVIQYRGGFRDASESFDTKLVDILVYRTELDGDVFYFTSESIDDINGAATITANEILYTSSTPAIDGNGSVGACKYIAVFDDRLTLVGGEHKDKVIYSKQDSINFFDNQRVAIQIPKGVFDANGIIPLDSRLLVFKKNKVFQMFGQGADDTGAGNYETLRELPFEQGLLDENSLVLSTIGVLYKSLEGIYLIDRSVSNKYLGSKVEDSNSLTINYALSVANSNEILFFTDTKTLVYNYENNLWSRNTGQGGKWAANHNSKLHYMDANNIYRKDTSFTENTTSYTMRIKTAWVKFGGLTGFQRVWRFTLQGVYVADHTVQAKIYHDYSSTETETLSFSVTSGDMEIEVLPSVQRCKAMQVELTFTGDNQNCRLMAIEFLVGLKGIKHRISKDKRAT